MEGIFLPHHFFAQKVIIDELITTSGHFENRLNPAQRIEFKSGGYSSGTARVSCFQTTRPAWISLGDETVNYRRTGDKVTLSGTRGNAVFTVNNKDLIDSEGVIWDKKFSGRLRENSSSRPNSYESGYVFETLASALDFITFVA